MQNVNDTIYDYKNYTIYKDRNHDEFVINDPEVEKNLISYQAFEDKIIKDITDHNPSIYLRFCDGEFLYYKNINLVDHLKSAYRWIRGMDKTCRGEKPDPKLLPQHFEFFANGNHKTKDINYFPHISNSYIKQFKSSKLRDYLKVKNIQYGHFYYVYHFLNKLRQGKIKGLSDIKIALIAHPEIQIKNVDHYPTGRSYTEGLSQKIQEIDFGKYDLILVGGGVSAPLRANSIKKYNCPIVDAGCLINFWNSAEEQDRMFCNEIV